MFQDFATFDLRESFFDLADEPFIVIGQPLNGLVHERLGIASLLRGNAVKLGLQLWGKFYFHDVSVGARPSCVKAFSGNRRPLKYSRQHARLQRMAR